MKKILILTLSFFSAITMMAQTTTTADRVVAKQSLYIKDTWIDGVKKDTSNMASNASTIPTSKTVYDFVTGKMLAANVYGFIANNTGFTSLSSYTQNGLTASVASGKASIVGAATTGITQSLDYNYASHLERWEQKVKFSVTSLTASTYGIGLGTRSINASGFSHMVGRVLFSSSALRLVINSGYSNEEKASLTIPTTALQAADSCELIVGRNVDTLYVSFRNFTQSAYYTLKVGMRPYLGDIMPNAGKYAIYNFGGTYGIASHQVYSTEAVNAPLMIVGDSKAAGSYVKFRERFGELLGRNFPNIVISGGGGDRTTEVLARLTEILRLSPKNVLLTIGCNDPRNGLTEAEYEANYRQITDTLTAHKINVFHAYFLEGSETFQPTQVAFLKATYPDTYIDCYEQMKAYPNTVSGAHPTAFGNDLIYRTVLNSFKIPGAINYQLTPRDAVVEADTIKPKYIQIQKNSNTVAALWNATGSLNEFQIKSVWKSGQQPSLFMGWESGLNDTTDAGTGGLYNTGFGSQTLKTTTNGRRNSAFGNTALANMVTGSWNVALGSEAMTFFKTGDENTAAGQHTLYVDTTGYGNTAMGNGTLESLQNGNYNTALGRYAGNNLSSGSYNVFIGMGAGLSGTYSNRLYVDVSGRSDALIYGEFDTRKLMFNASVGIKDILNMPASTAPTSSSDSSGAVGDIKRDESGNIYLKTATGWLKFTGVTF